jgi:hypothetical protein
MYVLFRVVVKIRQRLDTSVHEGLQIVHTQLEIEEISSISNQPAETPEQDTKPKTVSAKPGQIVTMSIPLSAGL